MPKALAAILAALFLCTATSSNVITEGVKTATKPAVETVVVLGSLRDKGTAIIQSIVGTASWYGPGFHKRLTANGERYDMDGMTAAHRWLPFGTRVRVTNGLNGKQTIVRINDRGPYVGNRVIDLSRGAAKALNLLDAGIAPVLLEVIS